MKDAVEKCDGQENVYKIYKMAEKVNDKIIYKFFKRVIDVLFSSLGLILLLPVFLVVSIMIKMDSKGKVFFLQKRIGITGKLFRLYKFRTMYVNADKELRRILENDEEARKEYKKNKKLKNDPRITKVGNIIRRLSIDELPQLINILKGEMTLIGPRPYLYREKKDMGEYYEKIISVKPGLTGLWQVSGRSDISFNTRLKLDKEYIENQSIKNDIKIFFKTFGVILKKEGAK